MSTALIIITGVIVGAIIVGLILILCRPSSAACDPEG
jgi:hypothetical protein